MTTLRSKEGVVRFTIFVGGALRCSKSGKTIWKTMQVSSECANGSAQWCFRKMIQSVGRGSTPFPAHAPPPRRPEL